MALQGAGAHRTRRRTDGRPRHHRRYGRLSRRQMHLRALRCRGVGRLQLPAPVPRRVRAAYQRASMPVPGELQDMSAPLRRNAIVALLGTPDRTEGSLNDPRLYDENGMRSNEKWIYAHLSADPAGVPMRIIYWWRYDFVGTVIRASADEPWRPDTRLAEALAGA